MGRSKVHSKIEKRLKVLRRATLAPLIQEQNDKLYETSLLVKQGLEYREKPKKNAFLHPNDADAEFPQYVPAPIIDLRGCKSEFSGHEHRGMTKKATLGHIKDIQLAEDMDEMVGGFEGNMLTEKNKKNSKKGLSEQEKKKRNYTGENKMDVYEHNEEDEMMDMMTDLKVGAKKLTKKEKSNQNAMNEEKVAGKKKIAKPKRDAHKKKGKKVF